MSIKYNGGYIPAVGADGTTLVANSSASTGVSWAGPTFAAGKNKIINGDFYINQRSFTSTTTSGVFMFDRWNSFFNGGTCTFTAQTFTLGTAPVAGYEGTNFLQVVTSGQTGGNYCGPMQKIEDVRTFANQTVTLSFWAKANTGTPSIRVLARQFFNSSADVDNAFTTVTISNSWVRYSMTATIQSIAGKTIGTGSCLQIIMLVSDGGSSLGIQNNTFQIWGVQLEAGSVATAFQTATGTLQGELAACQRYYYRFGSGVGAQIFGSCFVFDSTRCIATVKLAQTMRTTPTLDTTGTAANYRVYIGASNITSNSVPTLDVGGFGDVATVIFTSASTSTVGYAGYALTNGNNVYLGFSAEL